MPSLADVRQQYPAYKDLSDLELAGKLHAKFYSDIPFDAFAQKVGVSIGINPQTGKQDADFANLDRMMANSAPGEHQAAQPIGSFIDNNITPPVVGATIGSIATGGMGAIPMIMGAGAGGGALGALQEAQNPASTAGSISRQGLSDAVRMAGAEVAGIGASSVLGKVIAPNITPLRTLSEKAQNLAKYVTDKAKSSANALPEDSMLGVLSNKAKGLYQRFSEPIEHTIHAADKLGTLKDLGEGHLLAAAFGGPIGVSAILAKQLLRPGAPMKWLMREPMTGASKEVLQQTVTAPVRGSVGDDPFNDVQLPNE
jgi:hypothetical protein